MSVREIQDHLQQLYGLHVSPDLISTITDEVLDEVEQWQQRPLEPMYPIVYVDALRLKIRDGGTVKNKAVYLALGVRADGKKEVLGLWIEQTEGAKFGGSGARCRSGSAPADRPPRSLPGSRAARRPRRLGRRSGRDSLSR